MGRGICTVCQRFFNKGHESDLKCAECNQRDENDSNKVRIYIEQHSGATISDVIKDTGVSLKTLDRLVNEKRFNVVNNKIMSD